MQQCDVLNPIHAAKIIRVANNHSEKSKRLKQQMATEVSRENNDANSEGSQGLKRIPKAISDNQAKPLMSIQRDQDTEDGGKAGEMTANPQQVDAIVKRAWTKIHDGMAGPINEAVDRFLEKYN